MPRYFFDVDTGVEVADEIGRVLEGPALIKAEALQVVAAFLSAEAGRGSETSLVLSVRDESGAVPVKIRLVCQVEEAF